MPLLPRRLRRPKAELEIEAECKAPPDFSSGGVVHVGVFLLPGESFSIRRGWLELSLMTTHFSRTVLDGYHEHSNERVVKTVPLCGPPTARPGVKLSFCAELGLPPALPSDSRPSRSRPSRLQWLARVRLEVDGCRELSAVHILHRVKPSSSTEPVVDGRGFLPL